MCSVTWGGDISGCHGCSCFGGGGASSGWRLGSPGWASGEPRRRAAAPDTASGRVARGGLSLLQPPLGVVVRFGLGRQHVLELRNPLVPLQHLVPQLDLRPEAAQQTHVSMDDQRPCGCRMCDADTFVHARLMVSFQRWAVGAERRSSSPRRGPQLFHSFRLCQLGSHQLPGQTRNVPLGRITRPAPGSQTRQGQIATMTPVWPVLPITVDKSDHRLRQYIALHASPYGHPPRSPGPHDSPGRGRRSPSAFDALQGLLKAGNCCRGEVLCIA